MRTDFLDLRLVAYYHGSSYLNQSKGKIGSKLDKKKKKLYIPSKYAKFGI
jgi:hypothetical protein